MTQATDLEVLQGGGQGHTHSSDAAVGNVCPTCEQAITFEQFQQIRRRIEAEDRKQAEEFEEAVALAKSTAEAAAATQLAAVQQKSAEDMAALKEAAAAQLAEADKVKTTELAAARVEATKAATEAAQEKVIDAQEKAKAATDQLEAMKESHPKELAEARVQAAKAVNEAAAKKLTEEQEKTKAATDQLQALQENQDAALKQALAEQREVLEEDKDKALREASAQAFQEKQKFEAQVAKLTRQLQDKKSDELGEGAEVDLYDALKAAFPDDKIKRVKKGEQGADILHEVIDGRTSCGVIAWDSKNHKAWRNEFVDKLKSDQLAAEASHAVLSTHVFPAGTSQVHVREGVIILNPARAVAVATILRQHMAQVKTQELSKQARDQKMSQVYAYITSDQFSQLMQRMEDLTEEMLGLDVKEKKAHETMWNKRGLLSKSLQKAQGQLSSQIERIVMEGPADVEAEAG